MVRRGTTAGRFGPPQVLGTSALDPAVAAGHGRDAAVAWQASGLMSETITLKKVATDRTQLICELDADAKALLPSDTHARCMASVPLDTPTACFAPQYSANSRSNAATFSPRMNQLRSITPSTTRRRSSRRLSYWARVSLRGIILPSCSFVGLSFSARRNWSSSIQQAEDAAVVISSSLPHSS